MTDFMINLSEEEIVIRLERVKDSNLDNPYAESPNLAELYDEEPRCAAVLIPLIRKDDSWEVLFTRRNQSLPEHSGQVAFPGGRCDPGDNNPETTALREAAEEIGLAPGDVHILGRLNDFITITNYRVTPVVGIIPWPYPLQLAEDEVSRAFTIPLAWLAHPHNHELRQRELPPPYGKVSVIYFKEYDNEILWGASARLILRLVDVLSS